MLEGEAMNKIMSISLSKKVTNTFNVYMRLIKKKNNVSQKDKLVLWLVARPYICATLWRLSEKLIIVQLFF